MKPLPAAKDDPVIAEAHQTTATYQRELEAVRANKSLSELGRAQRIDGLWIGWQERISKLREAFYGPRRDRALKLEQIVPIGPGIPTDASPADAAVLHQAFNTSLAAAERTTAAELGAMYSRASRFGDDSTLRAVLTVASDRGQQQIIDAWAAGDPERQAGLRELKAIRLLFSDRGVDAGFARQAFNGMGLVQQPSESRNLALLVERA